MFKVFRIIVVTVFLIVFSVFAALFVKTTIETDNTLPQITLDHDVIEVKVGADEKDLLKGVSAYDEKDGDITAEIIVESVSRFIDKGVCKVTYAVCDSDDHVATATRKVVYTDYESPAFTLNKSLCFSTYEPVDVLSALDIVDCFDGSLKSNMIITSKDFSAAAAGVFSIDVLATNSKGDEVSLTLPLIVEDRSLNAPDIVLKNYLVYVKKGESVDVNENIISAVDSTGNDLIDSVIVDTNLNVNNAGVYIVHYYVTDDTGNRGHSTMHVVVESEDDD